MRSIEKKEDGVLIVPFGKRVKDSFIDGTREVKPEDDDYEQMLKEYEREQKIEKDFQMRLKEIRSKENKNE